MTCTNMFKTVIALALGVVVLSYTVKPQAAGFREQEAWKFRGPYERSIFLAIHQSKQLEQGGYFDGEHTARYYNIDADVENVDAGNLQFQEIINVGNQHSTTVRGDGNTLNVSNGQDSDKQSGLNGATAGNNSSTEGMLNVGE